jgi:23S rRNA C2498 (ribose-2'-O)-methylase RlmM
MSPLFLVGYLLATGSQDRRGPRPPLKSGRGRTTSRVNNKGIREELGRNRYTRDGIKKKPTSVGEPIRQEEVHPLPSLTVPNGSRPSYFSCRHGYEHTLIDEIHRFASQLAAATELATHKVVATSPYPGLVYVQDNNGLLPQFYDPTYALQSIPQCVVVSSESIKGLAREVLSALLGGDSEEEVADEQCKSLRRQLYNAPKGSLTIHPLVPGMCKGQTNPVMQHRSTKVGEELSIMLKKSFAAARKVPSNDNDNNNTQEQWILQIMLQSPNLAVASLLKSQFVGPGSSSYWPNVRRPLGLAKVDIEERMPSSAYRKLMEGIECMGICPSSAATVVDLGACPGGWTSVMRRYFDCSVIAVDRSELDEVLMNDPLVTFVKGDAFAYEPPLGGYNKDYWMISDVIAYPERATELLCRWCKNRWASNMIVTMKFQGDQPDLIETKNAIQLVDGLGYTCRVKHFFNNKNEVTFMVSEKGRRERNTNLQDGALGTPMYTML